MSWLASLPSGSDGDAGDDGAEAVQPGCNSPPSAGSTGQADESEPLGQLVDAGFTAGAAKAALAESSGDFDEALRRLLRSSEPQDNADGIASGEWPPKKRARLEAATEGGEVVEIEGYDCRLEGRDLFLRLRNAPGLRGPLVGQRRAGGAITFHGVDEWGEELYNAAVPRLLPELRSLVAPEQVTSALEAGRPWVWTAFASQDEVHGAHTELEALQADGTLKAASAGTTASTKARSDRVTFLDILGRSPSCPPHCLTLFRRLEGLAALLRWPAGELLLCPRIGMAAVYDSGGMGYAAHRDNERLDSLSGDHSWLNHRALTAIAYINPEGFDHPDEGGQLRCHVGARPADQSGSGADEEAVDVAPRGGTAVLFPSKQLLHEVLPSRSCRRYALTLWLLAAEKLTG